jgi:hypothetical protein
MPPQRQSQQCTMVHAYLTKIAGIVTMGCCLNKEVSEGWSSWKVKPLATRKQGPEERPSWHRRSIKGSEGSVSLGEHAPGCWHVTILR